MCVPDIPFRLPIMELGPQIHSIYGCWAPIPWWQSNWTLWEGERGRDAEKRSEGEREREKITKAEKREAASKRARRAGK